MQPDVRRTPNDVLDTIITDVPHWVQKLEKLPQQIGENQKQLEANDNRQVGQARMTLDVPPKQQELSAGSGSHNSITLSALHRRTQRTTTTVYYDGFAIKFFTELVRFVSSVLQLTQRLMKKERMERLVAGLDGKKTSGAKNLLQGLENLLKYVAKESESACHEVLRGNYGKPTAGVIARLNEVLNYARRIRAEP